MANLKLILREDVANLGDAGDLVTVKPGFARNYLLPQGKATVATESNIKQLEHEKRVIEEKLARDMKDLEAARDRMQALKLEITAQAGEEGRLFGSVTAQNIADLLAEKGIVIDRRKIELSEPIKELGDHKVSVKLRRDFAAEISLEVKVAE